MEKHVEKHCFEYKIESYRCHLRHILTLCFSAFSPSRGVPLYLLDPQTGPSLDLTDLRRRVEEFINTRHS